VYFLVVVIIIHELDILSYHFENPMFVFVGHFKVIYWAGGIFYVHFCGVSFFCIELVIDTGCSIYRVGQKSCTYLTHHIFGTV